MASRIRTEKEIREYCELNGIDNVEGFMLKCLIDGFNIVKYGLSPQDNVIKEAETPKPKKKRGEKKDTIKKEDPKKIKQDKKKEEEKIKPSPESKKVHEESIKEVNDKAKTEISSQASSSLTVKKRKIKIIQND